MENSQVPVNISSNSNTNSAVSLIPLPDAETIESTVVKDTMGFSYEDPKNSGGSVFKTNPPPPISADIPPEENPCTSRSTQETTHLADHLPLCYALAYQDAVGLQCVDGVWNVYSATDVFIQPGGSANMNTGVVLYSSDNTAMQIDAGPYGNGRFDLLSDQDLGNLWVQLSNPNKKVGVWIQIGEPIGELTLFLAQMLETKRKKKFTTSPAHIPGCSYPSTSSSLEVFPSIGDDHSVLPGQPDEMEKSALDLSSTRGMDRIDDDYPD
ncbi:unnamed protein product [Orchesella dallaii]|uniref:Uncharacterized protein n=1 Tax=Orchesella dallaii TaxID=48710 RepID=A0ABP1SA32_9HEXA